MVERSRLQRSMMQLPPAARVYNCSRASSSDLSISYISSSKNVQIHKLYKYLLFRLRRHNLPISTNRISPLPPYKCYFFIEHHSIVHGRKNYKDTKPYMSAFPSVDLLTDFAAFCLTDFIDWRYIHSWFVFLTQLVN